jgi:hypothetical protein
MKSNNKMKIVVLLILLVSLIGLYKGFEGDLWGFVIGFSALALAGAYTKNNNLYKFNQDCDQDAIRRVIENSESLSLDNYEDREALIKKFNDELINP